jgi:hypothetical protein
VDVLHRFADSVKAFRASEKEIATKRQSEFDAQTLGVVTDWAKRFKSMRNDAALEQGIRAWWRGAPNSTVVNPLLSIKFIQPSYEIARNALDVVLRKTVDALYVYRMKNDGKCYVQWRSFGYEALGGGTFSDEVKDWVKKDLVGFDYYPRFIALAGDRKISAGVGYEVQCTAFGG